MVTALAALRQRRADVLQRMAALLTAEQLSNPEDSPLGVRPADRILDPLEPQACEEVRKILGAIPHGDSLADPEATIDVPDHNPVFGLTFEGDDDLTAVAQITGLAEVLQRLRAQLPVVEQLEKPKDLPKNGGRLRATLRRSSRASSRN